MQTSIFREEHAVGPAVLPAVALALVLLFTLTPGCTFPGSAASISGDDAVQIALNDSGIRERIGNDPFRIIDVKMDRPFTSQASGETPPDKVWVLTVVVCHDTFEYRYHVDVTRDGRLYGISRPSHITYPPENMRSGLQDPCFSDR